MVKRGTLETLKPFHVIQPALIERGRHAVAYGSGGSVAADAQGLWPSVAWSLGTVSGEGRDAAQEDDHSEVPTKHAENLFHLHPPRLAAASAGDLIL